MYDCYVCSAASPRLYRQRVSSWETRWRLLHLRGSHALLSLIVIICTVATLLALYPGLPMFFNVCEKNQEGLVNLVM